MKPVFLIGYMGCGKTTLGQALAHETGMPYIDLDEFIECKSGMTIAQIFEKLGEIWFREIETEALRELAAMNDVIVGCGGGTPCHGDNMALMNRVGTTVWLTTSPERIAARLILPEEKCKRPKINNLSDEEVLHFVMTELEQRTPFYSLAQMQFDSTDIETAAATKRTAKRLVPLLRHHLNTRNEQENA